MPGIKNLVQNAWLDSLTSGFDIAYQRRMLNQLINVFWTIIAFGVTGHYWGQYYAEKHSLGLIYFFIVVSIVAYNIPSKWLIALTLSHNPGFYESIGIRAMRWLVQDGTLVSRIHQQSGKKYKTVSNTRSTRTYLKKIAVQERFHYSCFAFFALSSASALASGRVWMALFIGLANVVYNVCPILLQQYNRVRIQGMLGRVGVPDS